MTKKFKLLNKWRWAVPGVALSLGIAVPALAFVGFVTISEREKVGVTIYNSEDLTLVRDVRRTVMKQGRNTLRYQWSGTLIDPTSLHPFLPAGVRIADTTYPLGDGEALVWNLDADRQISGPMAIQYFTSGLTWRADHMAILGADGKARLESWIRVDNRSGEDFENTHVNLVVGEVKLTEKIRDLAQRFSNGRGRVEESKSMMYDAMDRAEAEYEPTSGAAFKAARNGSYAPKSVERESLSELHLYRIEGTESLPNGGGRRMRAFKYGGVAAKDIFRCTDLGTSREVATRVFSFKNIKENGMGKQPIPEGGFQLFRQTGNGLAFEGKGSAPYTPMGEEVEVPLGSNEAVACHATQIGVRRDKVSKDGYGRIQGYEELNTFRLKLINGSKAKANFEVRDYFEYPWESSLAGSTKEDKRTMLFKATVNPAEIKEMTYTVRTKHGVLAERKEK